jgi:predicted DNA-binding protein
MKGVIVMADNKLLQVAARITSEEKERLAQYCEDNDLTMSQVIRKAVKEYLEDHKED